MVADNKIFDGQKKTKICVWFVGERIQLRPFMDNEVLAKYPLMVKTGEKGCAILYRFGAIALIDMSPDEERAFLKKASPFITERFSEPESEELEICIKPDEEEQINQEGILYLNEPTVERLQVVTDILVKSAVLSYYEARVSKVFDGIEPLAEAMQRGKKNRVSGRTLLRYIGDVLLAQTRTVGRVEVTEKPEITWEKVDLDRLYEYLCSEYELRERDLALSRKLELISRASETLLDLMQNRRTLRVEWYIVILIFIEIVLTVYQIVFGY